MYKLLYPSIRARTAPSVSVSVRVRVMVSVSVSFGVTPLRILICTCPVSYIKYVSVRQYSVRSLN